MWYQLLGLNEVWNVARTAFSCTIIEVYVAHTPSYEDGPLSILMPTIHSLVRILAS